jgi:hypothetical protein
MLKSVASVTGVVGLLVAAVIATGCGPAQSKETGMNATITLSQAKRQVDSYVQQAQATLPGHPTLVTNDPGAGADDLNCQDLQTGLDLGTVQTQRTYRLGGMESVPVHVAFQALRDWSSKTGFRATSNNQNPGGHSSIIVVNHTGYGVTLEHNDTGAYYLSVSSPCVWPHGTPEPTSGP